MHPVSERADHVLSYSPKRKRALMVVESLARGGAERQLFAVTQGLLQHRCEVEIFELTGVVAGQSSFVDEFVEIGIQVRHPRQFPADAEELAENAAGAALKQFEPLLPKNWVTLCRALALSIGNFRPSVVVCWSDLANLIGGSVSRSIGAPRIILGQRVLPPAIWLAAPQSELYCQAYRQLAEDARVVFVNNSVLSAKEYERWIQLPSGAVRVVYNGFLPSSMKVRGRSERNACRAAFGLPADAPVVGGLMRFAPEKDPQLWLETAAAIAAARPEVYFLLAGYGHDGIADQLSQQGARLGLAGRLIMPGAITDVGEVYAALDVLLLSSRHWHENTPNVSIEAQAAGTAVVAPDVGGVSETIRNGVTGLIVADRSSRSLASAVLRVLDDGNLRRRAAIEGPAFVAQKFSHARMVREIMTTYFGAGSNEDRPWQFRPFLNIIADAMRMSAGGCRTLLRNPRGLLKQGQRTGRG